MVLTGSKEKQPGLAEAAQGLALVGGAQALAGVFDEHQPLLIAQRLDFVDARHGPAHVNGNDGSGGRGQGRFQPFRREAQRLVDIGKHRHRPGHEHRLDGGHEGEGGNDHLVAGANAAGGHGRGQGRRAAGAQMGVFNAEASGQFRFKRFGFPVALAGPIEAIAEQDAGFQHIVDLLAFFVAEYLKTGH